MPRKENIEQMFNNIASSYDKFNHVTSLNIDKSWRRKAVKKLFRPNEIEREMAAFGDTETGGLHVLDVACGTGDFSIAIAKEMVRRGKKVGSRKGHNDGGYWLGRVTGVDLSEGMLKEMSKKIAETYLSEIISCEKGDCEALRFDDNTFDRVSVAFGIRNFENREKGLREMLRVLRPGGELVILELSVPTNPVLRWLYNLYFLKILPKIGGKMSGEKAAYNYLPASVLNFPQKEEFMNTMRECGFHKVEHRAFDFGICRMYVGVKGLENLQAPEK